VTASLGSNPILAACEVSSVGLCGGNETFAGSHLDFVETQTPIEVLLTARWVSTCCGDGVFGGGHAYGSVDSSVAIDSSSTQPGVSLRKATCDV